MCIGVVSAPGQSPCGPTAAPPQGRKSSFHRFRCSNYVELRGFEPQIVPAETGSELR